MRRTVTNAFGCVLAGTLAATGAVLVAAPATASFPAHPAVVSETAASSTAQLVQTTEVPLPRVDALAAANGVVYLGGWFEKIANTSGATYDRNDIAAVDEQSGDVLPSFAPEVDARVATVATLGDSVFLGGSFSTVDGISRRYLVKVDGRTGAVDTAFNARLKGRVNDLEVVGDKLFVAGSFGKRLIAVDPKTGADTGYINLAVAGEINNSWGTTSVYEFAVDPARNHLVAVGNFLTVNGEPRSRAFMLDLGDDDSGAGTGTAGTALAEWYYHALAQNCAATGSRRVAYLQGVDFDPTGSYFVLVSTGFIVDEPEDKGITVCDAAARFETDIAKPVLPTWINYTGGDSLWAVAVTGPAVYVQGHIQCLDNPDGQETCVGDAVFRPGIGAIDPVTGKATDWNPDKRARVGGDALLATRDGLWVGSDSKGFGGKAHRGLAFAPLPTP